MAQMFYYYGCMNSGKSIELLKVEHNYREQGKNVLLLTSALDDRDEIGKVSSRIGLSQPAVPVSRNTTVEEMIKIINFFDDLHCILVDEAQFLTKGQVEGLAFIVDSKNIPVICYGLKNDFQNNLFEGSEALLIYADKVDEIKTVCWHCAKKAKMNLRINDGRPVYKGEQVQIGGNESYVPVCRKHYYEPVL